MCYVFNLILKCAMDRFVGCISPWSLLSMCATKAFEPDIELNSSTYIETIKIIKVFYSIVMLLTVTH